MSFHRGQRAKGILTLLLVAAMSSGAGTGSWLQDVQVVRSDNRGIVLDYRPVYSAPQRVAASKSYILYDFAGSTGADPRTHAGQPDLRYRSLPLILLSELGNSVSLVEGEYDDIPGGDIVPVPALRGSGDGLGIGSYHEDPSHYGLNAFLPDHNVFLMPAQSVRGAVLSSIVVCPVQYNPVTRMVRRYRRMRIKVDFGLARNARSSGGDPMIKNVSVLNPELFAPAERGGVTGLSKPSAAQSSVLSEGVWVRMQISDDGIYVLGSGDLRASGIDPSALDPRTIKIYGNGGRELAENVGTARANDLLENAITVIGEEDGRFDAPDYILWYGRSVRGWHYDVGAKMHSHFINHYSETNYYWMTFGGPAGKRMPVQPSAPETPAIIPQSYTEHVFMEEERINLLRSGKDWYGHSIEAGSPWSTTMLLPGLLPGGETTYRYALVARAAIRPLVTVSQGSTSLATHVLDVVDYESPYLFATGARFETRGTSSLPGSTSTLTFRMTGSDQAAIVWLDWLEIHYPRSLVAFNDMLKFRGPDTTGVVEYRLSGFSGAPVVLDVSHHENVKRVEALGSPYTFRARETSGVVSEYHAATPATFRRPLSLEFIQNQDLRGDTTAADFVIVTGAEYRAAADRLAAYRGDARHGNLRTRVVDVGQIYNEFGGGIPDVTAIRDYLLYAYNLWNPKPRYLLMFGQASYDYKALLGSRSSYVPTWQSDESRDDVGTWATDDFFVKFGPGDAPWLATGRLSPRTGGEADALVERIFRYESNSDADAWKLRMLFVGDDSWTPAVEDGTIHSQAAEDLATFYTPDEFEKKKIYLAEYPTVFAADGRRKPGAYQELIDRINEGVLIVNFTGHGNPTVWTHERVFTVETSIPSLVNNNRFAVFFAATCNFSEIDDPKRYTGSELLMNKPDGGAIGVLSATRKVFAGGNNDLHQRVFREMFRRDRLGRLSATTVAEALFAFKSPASSSNSINDQKFFFMGDPTMRLQLPPELAVVDSLNGESPDSADGGVRSNPITLKSLGRVHLQGSVRDENNRVNAAFSGTISLQINEASRRVRIQNFAPGIDWEYLSAGSTIFRGQGTMSDGRFIATFIVPRDISYADAASRGRMVAYLSGSGGEVIGYTSMFIIAGTDTAVRADTEGPRVSLYLDSRAFRPGDLVRESPVLIADLTDSSGINTSTAGIGHRMELWINNRTEGRDVSAYFSSRLEDYRIGSLRVPLAALPQGSNSLRLRVWDSFNNSSTGETFFQVAGADRLVISEVWNYPNPFAGETRFTFRQNQLSPLRVRVKVFTLAGRMIQSLETITGGEPFVQVAWDGRDRDGDNVANGVYLYKVIATTFDGTLHAEAMGKLSVIR